jgi:hypothetical protein
MLGALAGLAGAAVLFRLADGVAALYAGRLLHGVATGVATSALSAWLLGSWAGVDLRPCIHDSMHALAIALPGALACPSSSSRI